MTVAVMTVADAVTAVAGAPVLLCAVVHLVLEGVVLVLQHVPAARQLQKRAKARNH